MIVNFAPTGMIPTKEMTRHVPVTVEEILEDVQECYKYGINMVHLHARDDQGRPTHDPEIYARLIGGIRDFAPELIICVSLSGRFVQDLEQRAAPLGLKGDLKPDMGSLTLSSMNFPRHASVNSPDTVKALAKMMMDKGIVPELEIFDLGMINYAKYLIGRDLIRPPFYANLFLGNVAGAQIHHAGLLVGDLPENTLWSMAGLGDDHMAAIMVGMSMDGGVRVGLEDTIYMDRYRRCLATNLDLLKRTLQMGVDFGRKPMDSRTLRAALDLEGHYGRIR